MNPEDRYQIDSLAGKLASLQPTSASRLQAHAFYRAGEQAANFQRKPSDASSWSARVSVAALLLLSSSMSYYAGMSRSEVSAELAIEPKTEPIRGGELAENPPVVELAADAGSPAKNNSPFIATSDQPRPQPFANWPRLPQLSPEEYVQMVEVRTSPSRVNNTVAQPREADEPIDSMLKELHGGRTESLLRRWLSM